MLDLTISPDDVSMGSLYQDDVVQVFRGLLWIAHQHPDWPFSLLAFDHPVMRWRQRHG